MTPTRMAASPALLVGLSDAAMDVLCCMPQEPHGAVAAEMAEDCFEETSKHAREARGKVRDALEEIDRTIGLFRRQNPSAEWGRRETYGIRAGIWPRVERELMIWWDEAHRIG